MGFFSKLMGKFKGDGSDIFDEAKETGYVELGAEEGGKEAKIIVKPFILQDFEGIKPILDALREGRTISLVNIRPLKEKDLVELKRAVNKLKKTCDAIEGDIAGFGDDWIAAVPSFAKIHRPVKREEPEKKEESVNEYSSSEQESTGSDEDPKIEPY